MNILKPGTRNFFLLIVAFVLIGLSGTVAIASAGTETVPTATAEVAFEDLPEFAPKFIPVVARKRAKRSFVFDR